MARAQTVPAPAATPTPAPSNEVVVTGSRVIQNGNNSPTPVTVVGAQELQTTHPATVFQSLLDIPTLAGSKGGFSSVPTGNQANSGQISALNLLGLGPVRTLVLFDGHRVSATEQDGLVDANTIPQMLLQRVDVVTGGASAVYGSDAVGGVVNFITDTKLKGVKLNIQGGISQDRDAGQFDGGIAYGTELFGGRGHIEASFERNHNDGILHRYARPQYLQNWTVQGNGCPNGAGSTNCVPFFLMANGTNSALSYGGKIVGPATNPLLNYSFDQNGVLTKFANGSSAGLPTGSAIQVGGDGIDDTSSSLIPRQTLDQAFARFDFNVTDNIHYFLSLSHTLDHEFNYYGNVNSNGITISAQNAFLPAAYQQQLAAAKVSTFTFSKKYGPQSAIPPSNVDNNTDNLYLTTGFSGTFDKYKWDASYVHDVSELDTWSNYTFNNGRLFAALDAVAVTPANVGASGQALGSIVCRTTLTNPGLYPGCVPIDLFGPNSESAAAIAYVRQVGEFVTKLSMDDAAGNLTGAPFNDWAGPVNVAASFEWRRQGLSVNSTSPTVDYAPLNCTGLLYNCTSPSASSLGTPTYNGGVAPRTPVYMTVTEGALETDVPLLRDYPLVRAFDLNLAYRYANYSAVGNPNLSAPTVTDNFVARTWKAGIDWRVNDELTIRATRSQDIRAPNLNELFGTNQGTFTNGNTDYLTNSNLTGTGGLVQVESGGNPNLKPEVAQTYTAGLVYRPLPTLSFALDYFNVDLQDYITTISGATASIQYGCYAGNAADCALQVRPGPLSNTSTANAVTEYLSVPVNASHLTTQGIDFETNYKTTVFDRGFSLRGLLTYQPHIYYYQPGQNRQDYAGALGVPSTFAVIPTTRVTMYAHYQLRPDLDFDWETTWRAGMHQSPDSTLISASSANVGAFSLSNLTLTYKLGMPFSGQGAIYLNIDNIFNTQAPIAANYTASGSPGIQGGSVPGDDPTGRYFRIGLRARW
ncbi:MAG TPA: TonB-dependent receptor [Caulobacteraceae bacterium]|nr:TonB-dependent receptor [Caulobacteraceae bacterium]